MLSERNNELNKKKLLDHDGSATRYAPTFLAIQALVDICVFHRRLSQLERSLSGRPADAKLTVYELKVQTPTGVQIVDFAQRPREEVEE